MSPIEELFILVIWQDGQTARWRAKTVRRDGETRRGVGEMAVSQGFNIHTGFSHILVLYLYVLDWDTARQRNRFSKTARQIW